MTKLLTRALSRLFRYCGRDEPLDAGSYICALRRGEGGARDPELEATLRSNLQALERQGYVTHLPGLGVNKRVIPITRRKATR